MPFRIVRNDITRMEVDAIVNTANEAPIYSTGTDTAVYLAAGAEQLLEVRRKIGYLNEGEVAITPGFALPAKYIIHAVSPFYMDGQQGEADRLRSCYEKSLQLALDHGCESIAFPLIASGSFGYPKAEAMEIALEVIHKFLMKEDMMVYLVVFDREAVRLSGKLFDAIESYIDDRYVEEKHIAEYSIKHEDVMYYEVGYCYREGDENKVWRNLPCAVSDNRVRFPSEMSAEAEFDEDHLDVEGWAECEAFDAEDFVLEDMEPTPPAPVPFPDAHVPKRSLKDVLSHLGDNFHQRLFRLIEEKGLDSVEVYKRAGKDKKFFSKIKNNVDYQPSKHTVFAFAIGMQLSLDETKDFLACAGFTFSPSSRFDIIMEYVIQNRIYNLYELDCILYDFGEEKYYFGCE